jgi:cysteine desulfurase
VKEAVFAAEVLGYEVEVIPVDENGYINIDTLIGMIRKETVLVTVMQVNNEIGVIQDIESIGNRIKAQNHMTFFHVDGVQSYGKYHINPLKAKVDALTISAHKIHGPKGCGAIYVSEKVRLTPILHGGSQQRSVRSGTENVPGIVGLGIAAKEAYDSLDIASKHILGIKTYMIEQLTTNVEGIEFNGNVKETAYHILNIRVIGVKSEVLLHTLEDHNIFVSTGSACSSNKKNHSSTLMALNQNSDQTDQAIRLSFSKYNTLEEVDYFIEQLNSNLPTLRRFVRK